MEDISDADYVHAKRVCKDFEIKNVGQYHDFMFKVMADVFENFRNMFLEIYELDSAGFINAPGKVWLVALKKTKEY